MPIKRCTAPAHEFCGLGSSLPGRPGLGDDAEFVVDHGWVAQRPPEAGAGGAGCGDAGVDPLNDEFAFVFGKMR